MHKYVLLLHVLAATIWTGGHIVLAVAILPRILRERSPSDLMRFESAYEKIGMPALVIQVITGLWLSHSLVPDVRSWIAADNFVTRLIVLKLFLLAATVLVAADARFRIIPRLSAENLAAMALRIRLITLFSILFAVAGVTFRTGPWP
jgi:putative copper export protein